jgi:hypothetical protein
LVSARLSKQRPALALIAAAFAWLGAVACSSSATNSTSSVPNDAGSGAAGGAGGSAGSGGVGGGTGGSSGSAGTGGAGGCSAGERRCQGDLPQSCDQNGQWLDGTRCTPPTPTCSAGICAPFRVRGGINPLGVRPAANAIRLNDEALEHTPRLCNTQLCVSGGITR